MTLPDDAALPPVRVDIDIIPVEHEGRPMFVLRDPEDTGEQALALSAGGMLIVSALNGKNTLADIRSALTKATGQIAGDHEIRKVVEELDKRRLLETPAVQAMRRKILEDFLASPVRKATHLAGYPTGLEFAAYLGKFFRDPKGPGKPMADSPTLPAPPLGLVAPHIDLQRGGPAYAWSYGELANSPPPDLILALGVAHASPNSPWALTKKTYETPYGAMELSQELYEDVAGALWYDPLDDEWVHRKEHSLEFQALWLRYLWRDKTPPWLPVLCSTFERFAQDRPPSAIPTVEEALEKIGNRLKVRAQSKRVLILAGIDLAHVGPRFGDEIELGPEVERRIETEDKASLGHALALDADKFYLSVVADGHWRKVCGLSALYTSLRWIKAVGGKTQGASLLAYGQAPDPMGGIVSFAGAVFR
ncbi:MAG: AmmeMemoRadiSam system protein B [Elusimicrobia bacterium]|nr:AmmeMemoRadiSam system protein B [Elusimicrobiota bacterium]